MIQLVKDGTTRQVNALTLEKVNDLINNPNLPYGTTGSHPNSPKYQLASTKRIIQTFLDKGFQVRSMGYKASRPELRPFTNHVVRFIRDDLKLNNEGYIEIIMRNSHDGTSSVKLDLGFYRLVCSNGMISGKTFFRTIPLKHIGTDFYHDLNKNIDRIVTYADKLGQLIISMHNTVLSNDQVFELTRIMSQRALSDIKNLESIDYNRSFRPIRSEDNNNTLWAVFNRVQEKIIRGGIKYKTYKVDDNNKLFFKNNTSRAIRSINKDIELNSVLFDYAMKLVA